MCITIQITCKQFITLSILATLSGITYMGHRAITTNIQEVQDIIPIQCMLIDSTPVTDGSVLVYHNNWDYFYKNNTYYFTDSTDYEPANYICCVDSDNSYNIIECVASTVTETVLLLIAAWVISWCVIVCMCIKKENYQPRQNTSIAPPNTSNNIAVAKG